MFLRVNKVRFQCQTSSLFDAIIGAFPDDFSFFSQFFAFFKKCAGLIHDPTAPSKLKRQADEA
jgi:hypothetical protein